MSSARGRQQRQIFVGHVLAEIDSTHRQLELFQIAEAALVAVGLHRIEQTNAGRAQQLAHDRRCRGIACQKRGVDLALEESLRGVFAGEVEQAGRPLRLDAVGLEQRHGETARPAAFAADRHALAAQLRQPLDGRGAAVEDHERHVSDASQRHQIFDFFSGSQSALHDPDVDREFRIAQALDIFQPAFGRQNHERHAVAREYLAVLLGEGLESAAFRAAGEDDGVGRRGAHEMNGHPDRNPADQQYRAQRNREVAPRQSHQARREAPRCAPARGGVSSCVSVEFSTGSSRDDWSFRVHPLQAEGRLREPLAPGCALRGIEPGISPDCRAPRESAHRGSGCAPPSPRACRSRARGSRPRFRRCDRRPTRRRGGRRCAHAR